MTDLEARFGDDERKKDWSLCVKWKSSWRYDPEPPKTADALELVAAIGRIYHWVMSQLQEREILREIFMETRYDYDEIAPKVTDALRRAFPVNSTIVTNEGYSGRVHAKVVSEKFNGISEREKQAILWDALNDELKEEAQAVSLALAYGTDEL